ncbi:MAG: lipoate--protein ligase family protein, partial [Candidatus Hydrogenedentota bacterium]
DRAERGGGECLRFWESPVTFVVLGVGQAWRDEVRADECHADGVPIHRRCSAGGCVLQGPGCLNYSLVLDQTARPEVASIRDSYGWILGALARAFQARGQAMACAGTSDLAVDGRKCSGNAQRRRKRFVLHHGTILYNADLALFAKYLREPTDRPEYRGQRAHDQFVANLPITAAAVRDAVLEAFNLRSAAATPDADEISFVEHLVSTKYALDSWNFRR